MSTNQTRPGITNRVIDAIAEKENVDPTAMDPPLADVIDPDALEALLRYEPAPDGVDLEVQFTYRGHDVVVSRNEDVEVQ